MTDLSEKGRLMLDSLNLDSDAKNKRMAKRQISEGTYAANTPGVLYDNKFTRVNFLGARKPGVVPKMWSAQEDEMLRNAVKQHGEKNWRLIAESVPNRNHLQCLQRWKKALRPGLVKGHWSKDEDSKLLGLIKSYTDKGSIGNINWAAIAQQIHGRNAKQCRERWFLNLDPSINRGPWTAEEDRRLLELASQCGGRWSLISKNMAGRTENSVKTRFHSLQRQEARNRGWTQEEDQSLLNACLVFGRDWGKIVKQLPGRSRGQLKKRFSILTQHRPELVRQVQSVEDQIAAGKITPPNPPPPPIKPIGTQFLGQASQQPQSNYRSAQTWAQQQQQQQQAAFQAYQAPPPPPSAVQPPVPGQKKGMFRKYGSSWMAGIVDNLDTSAAGGQVQQAFSTDAGNSMKRTNSAKMMSDMMKNDTSGGTAEPPKTYVQPQVSPSNQPSTKGMQRQDSNIALLDKLLTEGAQAGQEANDFGNPPAAFGGEVKSKGLKQYNSWGSIGGGDFGGLFNSQTNTDTTSGTGAPSVMRTGSTKKLGNAKMSSGLNWGNGPSLGTYESTTDLKNFLTLL